MAKINHRITVPSSTKHMFSMEVIGFTFVSVEGRTAADIDALLGREVQKTTKRFLQLNTEIEQFYRAPVEEVAASSCGECLEALVQVVEDYGRTHEKKESLLVVVDEYDKHAFNNLLTDYMGKGDETPWETAKESLWNYRSFFSACRGVTDLAYVGPSFLEKANIFATGVLPVGLNVISGFFPLNLRFRKGGTQGNQYVRGGIA